MWVPQSLPKGGNMNSSQTELQQASTDRGFFDTLLLADPAAVRNPSASQVLSILAPTADDVPNHFWKVGGSEAHAQQA